MSDVTQAPEKLAPALQAPPPQSTECELGVLSSMLQGGPAVIEDVRSKIESAAFYTPAHQTIFAALCALCQLGRPVDLISVTSALRDKGILESVGGAAYITDLIGYVPTSANVDYYVETVREKFMLRELVTRCTETVVRVMRDQSDPAGILEDHQSNVIEIGLLGGSNNTSKTLAAFVPDALKQIEATYHGRGQCTGISTGFVDLDRIMNGFEAPLTYYFAARPAMGKSAIMLAFAKNIAIAAVKQRRRIGIFSVEMTGQMLAKRLICDVANIPLAAIRTGFMDHDAMDRAKKAADELMTDYILIDEKGDLSIFEYRARARRMVLKDKCEILMIDYLQRMKGSSKRAALSRELEINEIAQGISATGKELKVPQVILAQLNRKPEERKDGKPELGDLRESGSIEQEARFVGLLWRPNYYANSETKMKQMMKDLKIEDQTKFEQYAECIVAKQNEGPVGPIPLRFVEDFGRYESEDPDRPLYSTNKAKHQRKADDPPAAEKKPAAPRIVQEALDIFPGAKVEPEGGEQ